MVQAARVGLRPYDLAGRFGDVALSVRFGHLTLRPQTVRRLRRRTQTPQTQAPTAPPPTTPPQTPQSLLAVVQMAIVYAFAHFAHVAAVLAHGALGNACLLYNLTLPTILLV